jgi:hypothetical protein
MTQVNHHNLTSKYTLLVRKQRQLIGLLRRNFKTKSQALYNNAPDFVIRNLNSNRVLFQKEYDEVTLELDTIGATIRALGLQPYDYAPDPTYGPSDDDN